MKALLILLQFHGEIIFVLKTIEAMIPDESGAKKLDIALKQMIALDAKLQDMIPALTQAFSLAKSIYNATRS